jgi:hypothetical protein
MDPRNAPTVVERFAGVEPANFEQEIDQLWAAAGEIKDSVVEQVRDNRIPPLTGLAIVSCITGQTFGYGVFHGQPAAADLLTQLKPGRMAHAGA